MSDIIKPCPWFNHPATISHVGSLWWVTCDEKVCGGGPARKTKQQAIAAWNAAPRLPRATTPPNTVRVRVAVETNKDGFTCVYWVGPQEEVDAPSEPGNRITYASFNAFLPEPAAEIEAEIEPTTENR